MALPNYEINGRYQAAKLVQVLDNANEDAVLTTAGQLRSYWRWARPMLFDRVANKSTTPAARRQQLHARIALVADDKSQVPVLRDALLSADLSYVGVIRDALLKDKTLVIAKSRSVLEDSSSLPKSRFRAGLALAKLDPDGPWTESDTAFLVTQLVGANPEVQPQLRGYLADIGDRLLLDIEKVFQDEAAGEQQRIGAANAVSEFARGDVPRIARLASVASPDQYAILYPLLESSNDEDVTGTLDRIMSEQRDEEMSQKERVALGRRRAGAAITRLRLGAREEIEDDIGAFGGGSLDAAAGAEVDGYGQDSNSHSSVLRTDDIAFQGSYLLAASHQQCKARVLSVGVKNSLWGADGWMRRTAARVGHEASCSVVVAGCRVWRSFHGNQSAGLAVSCSTWRGSSVR